MDAVASVLKDWREGGRLCVTPPSSKDEQIAQKIVYLVERLLTEEKQHEQEQ